MTNIAETLGIEPWRLLFRARRAGWYLDTFHSNSFRTGDRFVLHRWREWQHPSLQDGVQVFTTKEWRLEGPRQRGGWYL